MFFFSSLQEDNIQGNIYDDDDDDEEMFEDRKDEKAEDEEKMEEVEAEKTSEEKEEKEENTESAMESNEDISKLLEETKVPELPNLELAPKKGIKFAETIAKVIIFHFLSMCLCYISVDFCRNLQ